MISRIGESVVHPATNALISQAVPVQRRGLAVGIKQAAVPLATALAGFSVPVLGSSLDWEGTFLLLAVLGIPAWLLVPPVGGSTTRKGQATAEVWRLPQVRLVALAGGLGAASVVTVAGFLTTAAEEAGYSKGTSGLLLTLGGFIMVAGRTGWGAIADRFEFDRFFVTGCSIAGGSVGYLLLATESKLPMFIGVDHRVHARLVVARTVAPGRHRTPPQRGRCGVSRSPNGRSPRRSPRTAAVRVRGRSLRLRRGVVRAVRQRGDLGRRF